MVKISFIGDVMFEKQFLKASKRQDGSYSFYSLFEEVKYKFAQSDYVVANLESVFGGGYMKYTDSLYSFNTPDEALDALTASGISMVSTANNHCLDRDIAGLVRTVNILKEKGIDFTGTYSDPREKDRSLIKSIGGIRFAFMSYTYGTNTLENKIVLDDSCIGHVNLLAGQTSDRMNREGKQLSYLRRSMNTIMQKMFSSSVRMQIKRLLGMPLNVPVVDNNLVPDERFVKKLVDDIRCTKSKSDVVFMLLHSGGQFNADPGSFTKEIVRIILDNGVDFIIGTHPHVVQKADINDKNVVFYSLGNFSISPSSIYVLHQLKPEYSVVPHFYFDKDIAAKPRLLHLTFSIFKIVENASHALKVYSVSDLYEKADNNEKETIRNDVGFIYSRLIPDSSEKEISIMDEYVIF